MIIKTIFAIFQKNNAIQTVLGNSNSLTIQYKEYNL